MEMLGLNGYKLGSRGVGDKEEKRAQGGGKSTKTVYANATRKPVTLYADYKNGNNL